MHDVRFCMPFVPKVHVPLSETPEMHVGEVLVKFLVICLACLKPLFLCVFGVWDAG